MQGGSTQLCGYRSSNEQLYTANIEAMIFVRDLIGMSA